MRLGRTIPLNWLGWFLIFLALRSFLCGFLLFLSVVFSGIKLAKGDLDVGPRLLVQFVRRRVELLHLRFARNHWQSLFEHFKHLVKVDLKVLLLSGLLFEEELELFLFLVDFKAVHLILTFAI